MAYTLYYTTKSFTTESTALIPHIALLEIGAPFEIVPVELQPEPPSWFLHLNPHGLIPTMIDPDLVPGDRLVIHPAAAILFHLADRHPEARLVPQPGTALRGLCYRRMFDMAEELQVAFVALFKATRLSTDPQCAPAIKARAGQLLQKRWGYIDNALGSGPYLLGKDYSICDIYMYVLARWSEIDHEPLTAFVNVRNTCARIEARPAVRAALTTDGIRLISRD